uniref:Uncharacterized protein n=1 Tax=Eutreptiella gymnastica TaxID=73025 RepID=A0A7S1NPZ5_9EUGL|mmetsp:Transcript_70169/g.123733  ORF Transcript_70169/g.123733 Transcript_70169/m.123733 type:complete len:176 (+) Transcript_70169:573-1100(+)
MWETPMPRTPPSPFPEIPWPKTGTVYHHKPQTGHPDLSAHIPVSRVAVLGPAGSTPHPILRLPHWMGTPQRGCFTRFHLARPQEYLLFLAASPQGRPGVSEDGAAWPTEQGLGEGWAPLIRTSATGWLVVQRPDPPGQLDPLRFAVADRALGCVVTQWGRPRPPPFFSPCCQEGC